MIAEEERRMISRRTNEALAGEATWREAWWLSCRIEADGEGPQGRSGYQCTHRGRMQPRDCGAPGGRCYVIAGHRSGPDDRGISTARYRVLGMRQGSRGHRVRSPAPTIPSSAHPLLPARNIPRIPHIPRGRTLATAYRGMGGKISRKRPAFVQCQENHVWSRDRPVVKWPRNASFRPTSECRCAGVAAGGYYNRCSSSCCRRSR